MSDGRPTNGRGRKFRPIVGAAYEQCADVTSPGARPPARVERWRRPSGFGRGGTRTRRPRTGGGRIGGGGGGEAARSRPEPRRCPKRRLRRRRRMPGPRWRWSWRGPGGRRTSPVARRQTGTSLRPPSGPGVPAAPSVVSGPRLNGGGSPNIRGDGPASLSPTQGQRAERPWGRGRHLRHRRQNPFRICQRTPAARRTRGSPDQPWAVGGGLDPDRTPRPRRRKRGGSPATGASPSPLTLPARPLVARSPAQTPGPWSSFARWSARVPQRRGASPCQDWLLSLHFPTPIETRTSRTVTRSQTTTGSVPRRSQRQDVRPLNEQGPWEVETKAPKGESQGRAPRSTGVPDTDNSASQGRQRTSTAEKTEEAPDPVRAMRDRRVWNHPGQPQVSAAPHEVPASDEEKVCLPPPDLRTPLPPPEAAAQAHETPLGCEICGFTCRQKASLNWHMKKHDAESGYQFPCDVCGKRFEKKDSVVAHKSKSHPETLIAEALADSMGGLQP
ncbi:protein shisa-8-like [Narcine bancroftii]|uniref:protein shisa-8-like n=1 Tax=Narcine bancroftii TaxID=1343680 RepID=UPI0038321F24